MGDVLKKIIAVLVFLAVVLVQDESFAASPKLRAKCSTEGQRASFQGKKFQCVLGISAEDFVWKIEASRELIPQVAQPKVEFTEPGIVSVSWEAVEASEAVDTYEIAISGVLAAGIDATKPSNWSKLESIALNKQQTYILFDSWLSGKIAKFKGSKVLWTIRTQTKTRVSAWGPGTLVSLKSLRAALSEKLPAKPVTPSIPLNTPKPSPSASKTYIVRKFEGNGQVLCPAKSEYVDGGLGVIPRTIWNDIQGQALNQVSRYEVQGSEPLSGAYKGFRAWGRYDLLSKQSSGSILGENGQRYSAAGGSNWGPPVWVKCGILE